MLTILLLIGSNIFMTFAWYGHLKFREVPLWKVILVSWGIAFFEYCLQVPANRIGAKTFSPDQLKVIQEGITLTVFGVFSTFYFGDKLHWNHFAAFGCLVAGAFLMFHKCEAVWVGFPPPLPGDKSFLFNGLRMVMPCKNVIIKGLQLNM